MAASRTALILTAFTVLATALIADPASAASKDKASRPKTPPPEPAMKVYVVTSAQDGCEPDCPQWIAAQGQIVDGSLARFKKALRHRQEERAGADPLRRRVVGTGDGDRPVDTQ
jgi:hypothetical protein